jgi:DHA1 family bicyclomycin/chloramphenicol resistance-like MFS transporter
MDARSGEPLQQDRKTPSKTPWGLLALLMAMTGIGPVSLNILVPALPNLISELQTDIGTVQLTLSLFLFSLATAQLLLGPLSDRFGRRPVVLIGLSVSTLASLVATFAWSIDLLIVARIVQAFGAATGVVVGRAIVRDLFERDRAAAMLGLVTTVMVVAPMFAPTVGGLLDVAFGWHAILLFTGLYSLLVVVWATVVLKETRPARPEDASFLRDTATLVSNRLFWGYVIVTMLGTAPFFTFIGGGPHVVITMMARSSAEYGVWFAVPSVGYMAGNFIASRTSQHYGINAMILAGLALELVGALVTILWIALDWESGPVVLFVPQFIVSVGNGLMLPNAIAGAVSVRPQAAGAASGITGFLQMAFGAAMAQAVTVILAGAVTAMPMAVMILVEIVLAGLVYVALARPRRQGS